MPPEPPNNEDFDVVVEAKEPIADGVVLLTLTARDSRDLPFWEPGAHIDLVLAPDLTRPYSLCGDPADRSCLQVAVLREANGRGGSQFVHDQLRVGDRVTVRGPRNNFRLVESARSFLFIAGGIGITPIKPMVAEATARGVDWRLVYGGRTRAAMAFRRELDSAYGHRVVVQPQDESGLLDLEGMLEPLAGVEGAIVYCCGPEALLSAAESECSRRGIEFHLERFAAKESTARGADSDFEVELYQSGTTVPVSAGVSISVALRQAGVAIPTSCEEGTCGTCETRVIEGVPDHRDSLLTEEEREANDTILVCVSRARSSRLVLDL